MRTFFRVATTTLCLLGVVLSAGVAFGEQSQLVPSQTEGILCERQMVRRVFGQTRMVDLNRNRLIQEMSQLSEKLPRSEGYRHIALQLNRLIELYRQERSPLLLIRMDSANDVTLATIGELIDVHYNRAYRNEPPEISSDDDLPWPEILVYTRTGTETFSLGTINVTPSRHEWNSRVFDRESGNSGSLASELWARLLMLDIRTPHFLNLKALKDSLPVAGWLELTPNQADGDSEPLRIQVQRVLTFADKTIVTQIVTDRGQIQLLDLTDLLLNYSWRSINSPLQTSTVSINDQDLLRGLEGTEADEVRRFIVMREDGRVYRIKTPDGLVIEGTVLAILRQDIQGLRPDMMAVIHTMRPDGRSERISIPVGGNGFL